jgi:hypothetical protein
MYLVLLMHQSLLVMLLRTILVDPTIVSVEVTLLVLPATLVVSLATIQRSVLRNLLVKEPHRQRKFLILHLLDVVV